VTRASVAKNAPMWHPRYGLRDGSKPMSGESLRVMTDFARSIEITVFGRLGSSSGSWNHRPRPRRAPVLEAALGIDRGAASLRGSAMVSSCSLQRHAEILRAPRAISGAKDERFPECG
jgi:hypothetical protein